MQPFVSVIVPNYNGGELFRECVRSLARLDYAPGRLEVFVIDDGSTDGSAEWLLAEPLPSFVHPLPQPLNRGRARARNVGLAHATGELVVFLDGDLTIDPNFVAEHVAAHRRGEVAAVVGRVTTHASVPRNRVSLYLHHYPGRGARQFGPDEPVPAPYLLTNNLSAQRRLLDGIGGFDEGFVGYGGEDTLLALLIEERHPAGIRYAPGPVAYDHDLHRLETLLRKFRHYGRHNLGRLLARRPGEVRRLHANWVLGSPGRRLFGWLLFNPALYWLVRGTAPLVPHPASNYAIRYLLGASLVRGFRERRRDVPPARDDDHGVSSRPSEPRRAA